MEQYGTTIRQIRLRKGFSHKEIYSGILSKSFAIEFEKGRYDIKFDRMLSILDRLMISVIWGYKEKIYFWELDE